MEKDKNIVWNLCNVFLSVVSICLYRMILGNYFLFSFPFNFCIILGIVASLVEIITILGLDNLTIPLAVFMTYMLLGK